MVCWNLKLVCVILQVRRQHRVVRLLLRVRFHLISVEAANVTNVAVSATAWDLRMGSEGGCGVAGCDPRLTRVRIPATLEVDFAEWVSVELALRSVL